MNHIVLTGATGFLGSHLLRAFLMAGYEVTILKRIKSDLYRISDLIDRTSVFNVDGDSLQQAFSGRGVDTVVHAACQYGRSGESNWEMVENNVLFALRVVDAALEHGVSTFINTDTFLPPSVSAYALSKRQSLDWLRQFSDRMKFLNIRIEHMYGPGDDSAKLVPWLLNQFDSNVHRIALTSGAQKRDFIYITDVVAAFLTVLKNNKKLSTNTTIEVGTGQSLAVKDFILNLFSHYEQKFGLCKTTLGFGEAPYRANEVMDIRVNPSTLNALGWFPQVSLDSGIEQTLSRRLLRA